MRRPEPMTDESCLAGDGVFTANTAECDDDNALPTSGDHRNDGRCVAGEVRFGQRGRQPRHRTRAATRRRGASRVNKAAPGTDEARLHPGR